jgi:hypothetical protein
MRITKKVKVEKEIVENILCNNCGSSLIKDLDFGGIDVDMVCGYGSGEDGVRYRFDLCELCVKKIMSGFKIAPEKEEYQ